MVYREVAKGKSFPDGTYQYTCGTCSGTGMFNGQECPDCYGLDITKIVPALRSGVRGQRYYALLKAFLRVNGKLLVNECQRITDETGKFTAVDIGYLVIRYGLNYKATCEWLEECGVIKSGIYERLLASKMKVRDMLAAAHEKYPELEE